MEYHLQYGSDIAMNDSTTVPGGDTSPIVFTWGTLHWSWWITAQFILAIVGITGNTLVIIVYSRESHFDKVTFTLIKALAVADLISSVSFLPIPEAATTSNNFFGHLYCKFVASHIILWLSIVASIFTLTSISLERFFAVVYPVKYRNYFTRSRPKFVVGFIWLTSLVINCHSLFVSRRDPSSGICIIKYGTPSVQCIAGILYFLLEYLVPVSIMVTTQLMTIKRLRQTSNTHCSESSTSESSFVVKARKTIIRMLSVVIVSFIICWTPDQVAFLVYNVGHMSPEYLRTNSYHALIVLAFINTCINPFIYAVANPHFRKALFKLVQRSQPPPYETETGTTTSV